MEKFSTAADRQRKKWTRPPPSQTPFGNAIVGASPLPRGEKETSAKHSFALSRRPFPDEVPFPGVAVALRAPVDRRKAPAQAPLRGVQGLPYSLLSIFCQSSSANMPRAVLAVELFCPGAHQLIGAHFAALEANASPARRLAKKRSITSACFSA